MVCLTSTQRRTLTLDGASTCMCMRGMGTSACWAAPGSEDIFRISRSIAQNKLKERAGLRLYRKFSPCFRQTEIGQAAGCTRTRFIPPKLGLKRGTYRYIHTLSTSPPHFYRSVFLERSYLSGVNSNKAAEIGACQGSDVNNDSEGGVDVACSVVIVCSTYIRGSCARTSGPSTYDRLIK